MPPVTLKEINRGPGRPVKMDEWDEVGSSNGYLDTREFAEYTANIGKLILRSESPVSMPDIRRSLGDADRRQWDLDAIDSLIAVGAIESYQAGSLTRSRKRGTPVQKDLTPFSRTAHPAPPSSRTHPYNLMTTNRRTLA